MASGQQIDIETKGPDGLPGIFWLINKRDKEAVGAWLDAGGDIEAQGFHRATPVLTAAIIDDWRMVLYLMERGARIDIADRQGFTLGYLSTSTRVDPDGVFGPALRDVRARLDQAGLLSPVYTPDQVNELQDQGRWPPRSQ